jgi:hypothetical protein
VEYIKVNLRKKFVRLGSGENWLSSVMGFTVNGAEPSGLLLTQCLSIMKTFPSEMFLHWRSSRTSGLRIFIDTVTSHFSQVITRHDSK